MKCIFFLICSILLLNACTTSPVTPSRSSRQIIDSLYQQKLFVLKPEMDSICAIEDSIVFKRAVDSILVIRQLEMDSLVR